MTAADRDADGELLVGEFGCVHCHAVADTALRRLGGKQAPRLDSVGSRVTPQFLRSFLRDPSAHKPGTAMPNLLGPLQDEARESHVEDLVHFLSSLKPAAKEGAEPPPPFEWDPHEVAVGERLFHSVGCVACHEPQVPPPAAEDTSAFDAAVQQARLAELQKRPQTPFVPLGPMAQKMTARTLADFLLDPLRVRPSGRMPNLGLTPREARAIAIYLLRKQAEGDRGENIADVPGLRYGYFEGSYGNTADFLEKEPKASGTVATFSIANRTRNDHFGFIFRGEIGIDTPGEYTFYLRSDDGSRLWVSGQEVIDHDGVHGTSERIGKVALERGRHAIRVAFFEAGGGEHLEVLYSGPGIDKQAIPADVLTHRGAFLKPVGDDPTFRIDPVRATRGRQTFVDLGCNACHALEGLGQKRAKAFAALRPRVGCLAESNAGGDESSVSHAVPRWDFSPVQRRALDDFVMNYSKNAASFAEPLDEKEEVARAFSTLNCYACHSRDDVGGPSASRYPYFAMTVKDDLGEEGKLPPHLDGVGAKLRPAWLEKVLVDGARVRPYMATRMPRFGRANVESLVEVLPRLDTAELAPSEATPVAAAIVDLAEAGRRLVGSQGFGCIQCHDFDRYASLGVRAMDLTRMVPRLQPAWFDRYLLDPGSLRPGTRMPTFWPDGESTKPEILDGNTPRQIAAIRAYLSKGRNARLPQGMKRAGMELVPESTPVIYRNFISDAGPRAIGVGYPEGVNLAFDANDLRPALIWKGAFIDASRHWVGRGSGWQPPLGDAVVRLTAGSPFAELPTADAPWPSASGKAAGYRFRGYRLDGKRRPHFLYEFSSVSVAESYTPRLHENFEVSLERRLRLRTTASPPPTLWLRTAANSQVARDGDAYVIAGTTPVRLTFPSGGEARIRNESELLLPVVWQEGTAEIVEVIEW